MMLMTALAGIGLGAATVVPLVVKGVIDGPLARGESSGIVLLSLCALGLGILESIAAFFRRYTAGNVALGLETRLRDDLYAHLQRLPVSLHDQSHSGQLL